MNCIKCYQEIPEGSKFCPYCGAQQPVAPENDPVNTQADAAAQSETESQQNGGYQYQDTQNYSSDYQNNQYQNNSYQNNQYQTPPVYQSPYEPEKPINWVPYLVLSILTTVCCCVPFGIVGIVYSAKINSAMNAGDYEGAQRAAKTAKIWIIVAAVVGLIANIIVAIMTYSGVLGSYYYYY